MSGPLSNEQLQAYAAHGVVTVAGLFTPHEAAELRDAAHKDPALAEHAFDRDDGRGGRIRLSLWNHAGQNIFGLVARSERIVNAVEQLIGEPVYHYHSKMVMKQPRDGGAWTWHQDYGYWHQNAILFPRMASALIALDPATRANGCIEVIPGSHMCGRLNHQLVGEQATADPQYVNHLLKRQPAVHGEMNSGDVMFLHCNTLHRSAANTSNDPRWKMICCYNAVTNQPFRNAPHSNYQPMVKVDDAALRAAGARLFESDNEPADWLTQPDAGGLQDALQRDGHTPARKRWWRRR